MSKTCDITRSTFTAIKNTLWRALTDLRPTFIGRLVSCISQDFDELAVFVDLFTHTVEHAHLLQFLAQVLDVA